MYPFREDELAKEMGVSRGVLKARRAQMFPGLFGLEAGHMAWSRDAVEILCRAMGLPVPMAPTPDEQVLVVEHVTRNKKIVMGWTGAVVGEGKKVRIMVRDSHHFCLDQRVLCRHREEDLWELSGRAPRSRGDTHMVGA